MQIAAARSGVDQDLAARHRLPVILDCPWGIPQSHSRTQVSAEIAIEEPCDARTSASIWVGTTVLAVNELNFCGGDSRSQLG